MPLTLTYLSGRVWLSTNDRNEMKTFDDVWEDVFGTLTSAKAIAFDTCHKIYILLDDEQVEQMREYDYDIIITKEQMSEDEMLITLKKWYGDSCSLRFVQSVETNHEDPNLGFDSLIPQGYEAEFCSECGEYGTNYEGYCDYCAEYNYIEDDEDEDDEED